MVKDRGTIPSPAGLSYLPFQKTGIEFLASRQYSILADEPGLGKTVQSCGLINLTNPQSVLVICPASMKLVWRDELQKWLKGFYQIGVARGSEWPSGAEIVIINYDILERFELELRQPVWDLLIVDEAHYLKNPYSGRCDRVLGRKRIRSNRTVFLTGTPVMNRPIELWSLLYGMDQQTWPGYVEYGKKFCDGKKRRYGKTEDDQEWDFSGTSNTDELSQKLKNIMIRRVKSEVLHDLPPKLHQIVHIDVEVKAPYCPDTATDDMIRGMMAKWRKATGLAKLDAAKKFIADLKATAGKVVVFAYHTEVLQELYKAAGAGGTAVLIHGDTPMDRRHEAVTKFQQDPGISLFLGQITAAGVGLTLTAASHVVFVELDWVPGVMTQAEDRCHRKGQKDCVNVYWLIAEDSLDRLMLLSLQRKRSVVGSVLDEETEIDFIKSNWRKHDRIF